jgi:hypothetical protein
MKTLTTSTTCDIFNEFALSTEEMIYIRGGEGDVVIKGVVPPIIL